MQLDCLDLSQGGFSPDEEVIQVLRNMFVHFVHTFKVKGWILKASDRKRLQDELCDENSFVSAKR